MNDFDFTHLIDLLEGRALRQYEREHGSLPSAFDLLVNSEVLGGIAVCLLDPRTLRADGSRVVLAEYRVGGARLRGQLVEIPDSVGKRYYAHNQATPFNLAHAQDQIEAVLA